MAAFETWLSKLFANPTTRTTVLRFLIAGLGYLVKQGTITIPDWVYGFANDPGLVAMIAPFLIPAGEKNAPAKPATP